jgi:hypothetical protein
MSAAFHRISISICFISGNALGAELEGFYEKKPEAKSFFTRAIFSPQDSPNRG